jgi:hypothetical protein
LIRVSRPLSWAESAVAVVVVAAPSQVAKSGAAPLHAVRGVVLSPSTRQPTPSTSQSLPRRLGDEGAFADLSMVEVDKLAFGQAATGSMQARFGDALCVMNPDLQ